MHRSRKQNKSFIAFDVFGVLRRQIIDVCDERNSMKAYRYGHSDVVLVKNV